MKKIIAVTVVLASMLLANNGHSEPTPKQIYQSFNMRTVRSSFGQGLKAFCGTYPKDFFNLSTAKFEKNKLILDAKEDYWLIEIINDHEFIMINKIKSGTYNSKSKHKYIVDKVTGEIRCNNFYIPESTPCKPYPEDWKTGKHNE